MAETITYVRLRKRGWRIHSTPTSPQPHMVYPLSSKADTCLEIGPYHEDEREWCVWLRSDIAHSRCRFCFLRSATSMEQLERLIEAITDTGTHEVEMDEEQFANVLKYERQDCRRRYSEYCRNERFSYVAG